MTNFLSYYKNKGETDKARKLQEYLSDLGTPTTDPTHKRLNRFRWLYRDVCAGQYRNIGETRSLIKSILKHDTGQSYTMLLFQIFTVRAAFESMRLIEMMPYIDEFNRTIAREIQAVHPDLDVSPLFDPGKLNRIIAYQYTIN